MHQRGMVEIAAHIQVIGVVDVQAFVVAHRAVAEAIQPRDDRRDEDYYEHQRLPAQEDLSAEGRLERVRTLCRQRSGCDRSHAFLVYSFSGAVGVARKLSCAVASAGVRVSSGRDATIEALSPVAVITSSTVARGSGWVGTPVAAARLWLAASGTSISAAITTAAALA